MNEQQLKHIQETYLLGHGPFDVAYADLGKLDVFDDRVVGAIISRCKSQAVGFADLTFKHHGRGPEYDGQYGAAVQEMLDMPRCQVPDHALPDHVQGQVDAELWATTERMVTARAVGDGNWAGCHQVGEFHSAIVKVDRSGMGAHLAPVFVDVLKDVQREYAKLGMLFRFVEGTTDMFTGRPLTGRPNIDFTFVSRSQGWIGLAVVGTNEGCQSRIWCKYLSTYKPQNVKREWTTLILHELGHNCGRGHTRGGIMNPSLVNGLGRWRDDDPSYEWLKTQFGGVPVGGNRPDTRPKGLEAKVEELERRVAAADLKNAAQDAAMSYLLGKVNS